MFRQLKVEQKLKLLSDLDWKSVVIPTPKDLKISPIYLFWHSEAEHPIISEFKKGEFNCEGSKYFGKCYSPDIVEKCYNCKNCELKIC